MKRLASPFAAALLLIAALAATLTGCATVPPDDGQIPPDTACVEGNNPGSVRGFRPGVLVDILEIDGYPTDGQEPYCVYPGVHRLAVRAVGGQQSAQQSVDLDLQGGRLISLQAQPSGASFLFEAIDVTYPTETQVAQFGVVGGYLGVATLANVDYYPTYAGSGWRRPPPPPRGGRPAPPPTYPAAPPSRPVAQVPPRTGQHRSGGGQERFWHCRPGSSGVWGCGSSRTLGDTGRGHGGGPLPSEPAGTRRGGLGTMTPWDGESRPGAVGQTGWPTESWGSRQARRAAPSDRMGQPSPWGAQPAPAQVRRDQPGPSPSSPESRPWRTVDWTGSRQTDREDRWHRADGERRHGYGQDRSAQGPAPQWNQPTRSEPPPRRSFESRPQPSFQPPPSRSEPSSSPAPSPPPRREPPPVLREEDHGPPPMPEPPPGQFSPPPLPSADGNQG